MVKLADGFNAADLRNVCTEAGMFAIRAERDYVIEEDFMKAVSAQPPERSDHSLVEGVVSYDLVGPDLLMSGALSSQVRKVGENKKLEGKLEYSKV